MRRLISRKAAIPALIVAAALALTAGACDPGSKPSARAKETASTTSNYARLVAKQPAHTLDYSPTRATKNFWIDTWGKQPNKLSYVYIQNANGQYGYYILKGLPVTYCVSLVPPEQKARLDLGQYDGDTYVQAPSMDGTYSSNSNCTSYYGEDAESGSYVEWSVGANQSYFLYSEPMSLPQFKGAVPLGKTTLADIQH
ncbi:hypothetical protein AB0E08_08095 [Streptomyces sp. NPDC048281]|uniref:hypothetical protein n=1 Tax=Streptomyces sp. NPDC048281 TaxID=3154715 RepID=UPI00343BD608